jgi:hypothetical protein
VTFVFRNIAKSIDLRQLVQSDQSFRKLRARMVDELGLEPHRADRILDDMMARAMTRFGDNFVRGKSHLLDQVVDLRDRLDTLYHSVLNFERRSGPDTGRVDLGQHGSIADQLRQIDALYRQIDDTLDQLRKPLKDFVPWGEDSRNVATETLDEVRRIIRNAEDAGTVIRRPGHDHRDIELDISQGRLTRRGFDEVEGSNGRSFTRVFAEGSEATFTIENGRYRVHARDAAGVETSFGEYDILQTPYARRPLTTSLMQAHHGLQNSLMTDLFGDFGYDGNAAPTIWLRNSRAGSPHGAITATQNSFRTARRTTATTLSSLREIAIRDLALTDMPHDKITAYIRAFDEYFEHAVLPQIPADQRWKLGDWKPPSGRAL